MIVTRSGRISRPYDVACYFPETANYQTGDVLGNGRWIKPFYYDKAHVLDKLRTRIHYKMCVGSKEKDDLSRTANSTA